MKGDKGINAYALLNCEFVNASQRGGIIPPGICTKRCKYSCTGSVTIRLLLGGNEEYLVKWDLPQQMIGTKTLVFCRPSDEPHACEDSDLLGLHNLRRPGGLEDLVIEHRNGGNSEFLRIVREGVHGTPVLIEKETP